MLAQCHSSMVKSSHDQKRELKEFSKSPSEGRSSNDLLNALHVRVTTNNNSSSQRHVINERGDLSHVTRPVISHVVVLQECVRDASRQLAHLINAVNAVDHKILTSPTKIARSGMAKTTAATSKDDVDDLTEQRREWRRRRVRVIGAAQLYQRLTNHCRTVSDEILPTLIEALRTSMMAQCGTTSATTRTQVTEKTSDESDDGAVRAQLIFVGQVIGSLRPCIHTILVARQFLDEMNDPNLVASLTSLVLAVAESVSRLRSAATTSLNKLAFSSADEEQEFGDEDRGLANKAKAALDEPPCLADDDDGGGWRTFEMRQAKSSPGDCLPLASMEMCDAACRQIQNAGSCLERFNWSPDGDSQHITSLLGSIINSSYEIGSLMEVISRSLECRDMSSFNTAITQFTDHVCRLMVSSAQVGTPDRHLMVVVGAIRHCACSLVTCARLFTGHSSFSYTDLSVHSRALSRALTELIKFLSSIYKQ